MESSKRLLLALLATLAMPAMADAADVRCTEADKSTWLPAAAIKKLLQEHGFADIGAVKANDRNCYVVQATDQSGAKKTLYLDPTDGALMALE
ncbi:MAG: PepSY domain-containing protein [Dongiaceae bacterium]